MTMKYVYQMCGSIVFCFDYTFYVKLLISNIQLKFFDYRGKPTMTSPPKTPKTVSGIHLIFIFCTRSILNLTKSNCILIYTRGHHTQRFGHYIQLWNLMKNSSGDPLKSCNEAAEKCADYYVKCLSDSGFHRTG